MQVSIVVAQPSALPLTWPLASSLAVTLAKGYAIRFLGAKAPLGLT